MAGVGVGEYFDDLRHEKSPERGRPQSPTRQIAEEFLLYTHSGPPGKAVRAEAA
jgi:hypothetical protein